jgi:5-methylcytosine-specific restriction endonuclease McrA
MKRRKKVPQYHNLRDLRARAYRAQDSLCYWCKRLMTDDEVTGDHLTPLYAGGKTEPGNIVAACPQCNSSRNSETNRLPKGESPVVATIGNDTVYSPFELLRR